MFSNFHTVRKKTHQNVCKTYLTLEKRIQIALYHILHHPFSLVHEPFSESKHTHRKHYASAPHEATRGVCQANQPHI